MKQHQEISKYSIRKLAKGAGALLISSVLLFSAQNNASATEQNSNSAIVMAKQLLTHRLKLHRRKIRQILKFKALRWINVSMHLEKLLLQH